MTRGSRFAVVIATTLILPVLACSSYESGDTPTGADAGADSGKGQIQQDGLTIVPADLTVPTVKCGVTSTGAVTLINNGTEDQAYEATLPPNDVFTIKSGATGTVKPHDTATIVIEAKSEKPSAAAVNVAIKTKSAVGIVSVKAEVQGSTLTITPHTADFGLVKETQVSAPINAIFTNAGSSPITINGFNGPDEKSNFTFPATIIVPANGTITSPITMNAGPSGPPIAAVVTPIVDSSLCGAPESLIVTGQRVSEDVVVNPAAADFGDIDCNATTPTKATITISNFSTVKGASFTASLAANSRFSVSPSTGTIAAAAAASIPQKADLSIGVMNAGDTFGTLSETLQVAIAGGKTYPIKLTMSVRGAELQVNPTSLSQIPNGGSKSFNIKNVGNAGVCITVSSNNNAFSPTSNTTTVQPNFPASVDVKFSSTSGNASGTITITPSAFCLAGTAVLCKPAPTVAVTGSGFSP